MSDRMSDSDAKYFSDIVRACKKQACLLILCEMERAREAEKDLLGDNEKLASECGQFYGQCLEWLRKYQELEKENVDLKKLAKITEKT